VYVSTRKGSWTTVILDGSVKERTDSAGCIHPEGSYPTRVLDGLDFCIEEYLSFSTEHGYGSMSSSKYSSHLF
jgi:hypothetical protein